MDITKKLRAGHVRRWHIVAVAREQSVAEHMHRVGVIAEEILCILGRYSWDSNLTINVMRWAFIHDRSEVVTGDTPTPAKSAMFKASEVGRDSGVVVDPLALITALVDPEAEDLRICVEQDQPLAGAIVKLADLIEAMNYVGIFGCGEHALATWQEIAVKTRCQARKIGDMLQPDPKTATNRELDNWARSVTGLEQLIDTLLEGTQWR